MSEIILRGGTILTMDPSWRVLAGDVYVKDGVIAQVGGDVVPQGRDYAVLDATGCVVMPGLVQSHVHTCQTLARGRADDLELLDWLRRVVWPYEGALSEDDVAASARLAAVELLRGGTTAIQDMATVRHTDAVFAVMRDAGIRATVGKAMMDDGGDVPASLREGTRASLDEAAALCKRWHGTEGGRLRYAYSPRFVLCCTEELLRESALAARRAGARLHTHASENRDELAAVRDRCGADNVIYLDTVGMTGPDVGLAHCVWLSPEEEDVLLKTGTHLLHCPSSNLKLASGVAPVPELLARGASVSLGADGAPCNNNLDAFVEMRLAGLVHRPRVGPKALHARTVVHMATMGGARALGLEDSIGSLEVGKRGDVIVVDIEAAHATPTESPYSALVFACHATDVRHAVIDGRTVLRDRELLTLDAPRVVSDAKSRGRALFDRL